MKDYEKIITCYTQYGFNEEEHSEHYAVFSLNDAVFPGVDIVVKDERYYENLRKYYLDAGYSTNKIKFVSYEAILDSYTFFQK